MKIRLLIPILAGLLFAGIQLNGGATYTITNRSGQDVMFQYCFFQVEFKPLPHKIENCLPDWELQRLKNGASRNFDLGPQQTLYKLRHTRGGFLEITPQNQHLRSFTINSEGSITGQ